MHFHFKNCTFQTDAAKYTRENCLLNKNDFKHAAVLCNTMCMYIHMVVEQGTLNCREKNTLYDWEQQCCMQEDLEQQNSKATGLDTALLYSKTVQRCTSNIQEHICLITDYLPTTHILEKNW